MENSQETITFGVHYMLDGYGAEPALLKDVPRLEAILEEIPKAMGMHAISNPTVVEVGPKNQKDPGGVSGFVLIAESHVSFHTFPAREFITIDVYTCQNELDVSKLTSQFVKAFSLKDYEEKTTSRGTKYPAADIH